MLTLLSRATPAPLLAWLLVPLAVLCCTVPLLCTILAIQIVLVRFFSGPLLRLVLASLAALASVGFSAWLLVGLFAQSGARPFEPTAPLAIKVPWIVDTSAALLAAAAAGRFDTLSLRAALGWLGLTISLFWIDAGRVRCRVAASTPAVGLALSNRVVCHPPEGECSPKTIGRY